MDKLTRFSPEVRERAVRLVCEHQGEHLSQWAAISSIAGKIGCTAESLRRWVRQAERDLGKRSGLSTSDRDRLKESIERRVDEADIVTLTRGARAIVEGTPHLSEDQINKIAEIVAEKVAERFTSLSQGKDRDVWRGKIIKLAYDLAVGVSAS